ncbi:MAG: cytochrome c oxidase subunit II [Dichotomicrobium sp.]
MTVQAVLKTALRRFPLPGALAALFCALAAPSAIAQQPEPWALGMQDAATPIMAQIVNFHWLVLVIITAIVLLVTGLLAWVVIRCNRSVNPEPARFHHNTPLEVVWTVVPILILIVIAIPSFRLLYAQQSYPTPDLTIKATGYQWYWQYDYPDQGFSFGSYMVEDADLQEDQPRLLSVDADVVVPVDKTVQVLVTSADVIHSWTVPAFGSKIDAIPGKITRTWFRATETGTFYGQCSELCGTRHAFMPIAVRVVTQEEYDTWLEQAQEEYARKGHLDDTLLASGEPLHVPGDTQLASAAE